MATARFARSAFIGLPLVRRRRRLQHPPQHLVFSLLIGVSPQRTALNEVFEQIAHIANLRDKLAHQHMTPHPDNSDCTLISDGYSTRKLSAHQTWQVGIADIDNAADDLLAARRWFGSSDQSGTLFKKIPASPPTWRYRPSSLELLDPETARALLARRNQPPASKA